jgi:L-threonylcarbamoyladenylate synthase
MDIIGHAVRVLVRDGLVIYPTETIYGLGADVFSDHAIRRVYEAKQRDLAKPISIAVSDIDMLAAVADVDDQAERFIGRFLPGPVTVVLKATQSIPDILTGGTGMIGIRMPAHEIPQKIIGRFDAPITATSANRSGGKDPTTLDECHIPHDFHIDGGKLPGTPSTVVDLGQRAVLRRGTLAAEVEAFLAALD